MVSTAAEDSDVTEVPSNDEEEEEEMELEESGPDTSAIFASAGVCTPAPDPSHGPL